MVKERSWLPQNSKGWVHHSDWPASAGAAPTEKIYGLVNVVTSDNGMVQVQIPGVSGDYPVPLSAIFPANEETTADMATMFNMSEATVLDNLLQRYMVGEPYTSTGNILMSVNPCRLIPALYGAESILAYAGQRVGDRPPHLYAIAEQAYCQLITEQRHQGLVISGVSGAGKTEANKYVMRYLCWRASHTAGQVGKKLVRARRSIRA